MFTNLASLLGGEKEGARPREPGIFLTRENLQQENKHHLFPFCNKAKGRQEGQGPPHEQGVEERVEVNPGDIPMVIFLSRQNFGNKMVPVEELLVMKDV